MGLASYILYLKVSIFQKKELSQISHDKLFIPYYRQCINTDSPSPFQSNGFNSKSRNVVSNDNKSCSNHQLSVPDLTWGWRLYLFLQGYVFIYVNTDMGIERFLFLWRGRWRRHVKIPDLFGYGDGGISSSPLNTNKYGS
jgi:hypothetical protein